MIYLILFRTHAFKCQGTASRNYLLYLVNIWVNRVWHSSILCTRAHPCLCGVRVAHFTLSYVHCFSLFVCPLYCLSLLLLLCLSFFLPPCCLFFCWPLCCISFIWPMYCRFLLATLLSPSLDHYMICPSINGHCVICLSFGQCIVAFFWPLYCLLHKTTIVSVLR